MHPRGRHGELRASRAAAEQVDGAPGCRHLHCQLPGRRPSDGLEDDLGAAALRQFADAADVLEACEWRERSRGHRSARPGRAAPRGGRGRSAGPPASAASAQSISPSEPPPTIAALSPGASDRLPGGRESRRRAARRAGASPTSRPSGQAVEAAVNDALRHEHLLAEAAEQVQEVLAEALAAAPALVAGAAGRGVRAEHDIADGDSCSLRGPKRRSFPANSCPRRLG